MSDKSIQHLVSVLVNAPVDKAYTYKIPENNTLDIAPGAYCRVFLGNKKTHGVVWDTPPDDVPPSKLKSVDCVFNKTPMHDHLRDFVEWVATYTMNKKGAVLKMCMSVPDALEDEKGDTAYKLPERIDSHKLKSLTAKQQNVIEILRDGHAYKASIIAKKVGCGPGVIKNLAGKGLIEDVTIFATPPCTSPNPDHETVELTEDQAAAATALREYVQNSKFSASLLDGVTGSGKTEVYFEAVAEAIRQNKQILILMPEIALSQSFIDRFKKRFGCLPAIWHSSITPAKRRLTWQGVSTGRTKVVIGARSSLFLPYKNLGLIIIDEEHDPAYKQEDGVLYNARDMAVVRASKEGIPIALVSATPSLETMVNAWNGKYHHHVLTSRFGKAELPDIALIDLKEDKPERGEFIAPSLMTALVQTLEKGLQSLLFLNRRGYAPLTLCRSCGYRFECPRCTAWLVEHRQQNHLECHHCGYHMRVPNECPSCSDTGSLTPCGPGVERITHEIQEKLPQARLSVLSSDTVEDHNELQTKLAEIKQNGVDIIIGTQIIAKGHHFPKLATVGVIDADLGLTGGDLRAAERTYQLLHQVSGRAGREAHKGTVYLQTFMPENKVMQTLASGERDAFLKVEAEQRKMAHLPPYSRLAGIILSSTKEGELDMFCRSLAMQIPADIDKQGNLKILGPAVAPIARIRGKYRRRFLIIADKNYPVQKAIDAWMGTIKCPSHIRIQIDIDPQSFF